MVLHAMLVSVQSSIDIATEIIAMKGLRRPQSYRDTFGILAEEGILSPELARPLADLAGFRECPCPYLLGPGSGPGIRYPSTGSPPVAGILI